MDKKIDEKIEEKVEGSITGELKAEIKKEIDKELKKEVEKEAKQIEKQVRKGVSEEIKKRIHQKIFKSTVNSVFKLRNDFREQMIIAITAAFAFLIALSWRNPIQKSVEILIEDLGLTGQAVYIEYLSALIITLIAVFVLMLISKWKD